MSRSHAITLALVASALMVTGCNTATPCDAITVGDSIEQSAIAQCAALGGYGFPLAGTCSQAGTWTCAVASRAHDNYASTCAGVYRCLVELDSAGHVMCVRHFCQD
jgi:hypothetical protein